MQRDCVFLDGQAFVVIYDEGDNGPRIDKLVNPYGEAITEERLIEETGFTWKLAEAELHERLKELRYFQRNPEDA
jgi:hypothetical protein